MSVDGKFSAKFAFLDPISGSPMYMNIVLVISHQIVIKQNNIIHNRTVSDFQVKS